MLDLMRCRVINIKEIPVVAGVKVQAEGSCMISTLVAGSEQVNLSDNGANSVFAGFSYGFTMTPLTKSIVEQAIVPATGPFTATLSKGAALLSGQISIIDVTNAQTLSAGNPATTANEYAIAAGVVTFHAGQAGSTVTITYRYTPTAEELFSTDKFSIYSKSPSDVLGSIGVVMMGEIFTSEYDAAIDWAASGVAPRIGNGGVITSGGSSALIPSGQIIQVPNAMSPFLGIRFKC